MLTREAALITFLKQKGGIASFSQLIEAGFDKKLIKLCLINGNIKKPDNGLYTLTDGITLSNPDFVSVAIRIPNSTICLLSALAFYESTNEISKYVDVAIPRGAYEAKIHYPPVRFYRFSSETFYAGINEINMAGHTVKIYNLAKTIADCFKFRNKIGINVAIDALKWTVAEKRTEPKIIMEYAKICRVDSIVKPILEAVL